MKNKLLITLGLVLLGFTSFAQSNVPKIGYTNVEYVIQQLPEYSQIEKQIEEHAQQLEKQLQAKVQEFQQKGQEYQQSAQTMIPEVRQDKEQELQNLQQSIQKFQREADVSIQRKQSELLEPVYEKVEKAITKVAKDNGFTHVFSDGSGMVNVLLYASEDDDITNLVLKELGVTPSQSTSSTE